MSHQQPEVRYMQCSSCQSIVRTDHSHCSFCGFELPVFHEYEEQDGFVSENVSRTLGNRISSIQNVRATQSSQVSEMMEALSGGELGHISSSVHQHNGGHTVGGGGGGTDFVPQYVDVSLTDKAPEKLPHPIQCFLSCYQRILMHQLSDLIEKRGFSPNIKHTGGQVWFRFLDSIRLHRRFAVEDIVDFYTKRKTLAHQLLTQANMMFETHHIEQEVAKRYKERVNVRKSKAQQKEEKVEAAKKVAMKNKTINMNSAYNDTDSDDDDDYGSNEFGGASRFRLELPAQHRVPQLDVEKELMTLNVTQGAKLNEEETMQKLYEKKKNETLTEIGMGRTEVPRSDASPSYMQLIYRSYLVIDENDYENNFTWSQLPTPSDTLLFCYLACLKAREPIMLNDLRRWALEGSFPYRNVCATLAQNDANWRKLADNTLYFKQNITYHHMHRPFVTQYSYVKSFRDDFIGSPHVLWMKLHHMYYSGLDIYIPPVHCETYVHRLCHDCLLLSEDDPLRADVVRYTTNLIKLYHNTICGHDNDDHDDDGDGEEGEENMNGHCKPTRSATMNFWFSEEERSESRGKLRRVPPEIQISAYLIIAMKLRFGMCENEAVTDKIWTLMVLNMILRSNERHESLLGPLIEKYQLSLIPSVFQHRFISADNLMDILSLGTFDKFVKREDTVLGSNYQTPHNIAATMVDYLTNMKDAVHKDGPAHSNPYTLLIERIRDDPDFNHIREVSNRDSDDKLIHYYSKRYIKYDAARVTDVVNKRMKLDKFALSEVPHRANTDQDQYHIQYSFLVEALMAHHEFKEHDLHLLVTKLEKFLFVAAGIGHEYNQPTNKVNC